MADENEALSKGERTKAKILEKAADLFTEKGYTAVSMSDVCQATNLSRGGLYRHFSSTAEMMILLMRSEQQQADFAVQQNLGAQKSAISMLNSFLTQHYRFMLSPRGRLELAINQFAQTDEQGREENRRRIDAAVNRAAELIRYGQAEGSFRSGNPDELAFHVIMAIGGLRSTAPLLGSSKHFLKQQLNTIRSLLLTPECTDTEKAD